MPQQTNTQKLDALLEKVTGIEATLLKREHIDKLVIEHDEFINGNGKPGAKAELKVIQNNQKIISAIDITILVALIVNIFVLLK